MKQIQIIVPYRVPKDIDKILKVQVDGMTHYRVERRRRTTKAGAVAVAIGRIP